MQAIIKQNVARAFAIKYAQQWIGTPYLFGGDDFSGFDCSGAIMEILQAAGVERRGNDLTADGLLTKYANHIVAEPYAGCMVFIIANGRAKHVGFMIHDNYVLHAGGGGRSAMTIADAIDQNAYVRCDPISHFGNVVAIDPFFAIT